jgi:hypothetical protein
MKAPYFECLRYYVRHLLGLRYKISDRELPELQSLSLVLVDSMRMFRDYTGVSKRRLVVSIFDLAGRFRETPDRIEAALFLAREMTVRPLGWGRWEIRIEKQPSDMDAA